MNARNQTDRKNTFRQRGRKVVGKNESLLASLHVLDSALTHCEATVDAEWRRALIREAAYYHAERRGFEPGYEVEDWLAAEAAIDAELAVGHTPVPCSA